MIFWLRIPNLSLITGHIRHTQNEKQAVSYILKKMCGKGGAVFFKNVNVIKDKEKLLEMFQMKED